MRLGCRFKSWVWWWIFFVLIIVFVGSCLRELLFFVNKMLWVDLCGGIVDSWSLVIGFVGRFFRLWMVIFVLFLRSVCWIFFVNKFLLLLVDKGLVVIFFWVIRWISFILKLCLWSWLVYYLVCYSVNVFFCVLIFNVFVEFVDFVKFDFFCF